MKAHASKSLKHHVEYARDFPRLGLSRSSMVSLTLLILLATISRGGNRSVALLILEWLALATVVNIALSSTREHWATATGATAQRTAIVALLLCPLWIPAAQLLIGGNLHPESLAFAALTGIPVSVCFFAALWARNLQIDRLVKLWLSIAVFQAAIGLAQLSGYEGLFFRMVTAEPIVGTFASKNTYSNLLVMAIPLAIHCFFSSKAAPRGANRGKAWGLGIAIFLLVVTVTLANSRAGIATGFIVLLLSIGLLAPRRVGSSIGRLGWLLIAAALLILALITGGLDWLDRFDAGRLETDNAARGLMREATWQGAIAYWPWGSGLGSYRWVFPEYHPSELGARLIDMAHNDYLQLLMELGVGFVLIAALVFALVARRVVALWRAARGRHGGGWREADRLAVACGLGALATALHALVDYPFHIPANAMFSAFLLGVFLREPEAKPRARV